MNKVISGKRIFFYTVLIIIPVLVVMLLELGLRLFSYGDDLTLFISSSGEKYLTCNRVVGKRYFSKFEQTTPLYNFFLKEKPENGYRIFVMGESTVQGFPYDANVAVSRILQQRLQDIFPNRTIEVINLGMTAINSYTLLDFADELLQQKPDVVLIYAGHNEYYGALGVGSMESGSIPGWIKKLHLKLAHLKTYQLLQNTISGIYKIIFPVSEDEAKETLMQQMVGKNIIPYNSELYKEGLKQFHENMSGLLQKLRKVNVPVIISDLVSNIKDLPPFYSISDGKYESANSLYIEARQLEADSLFERAKEKYFKAKDLDAIRFRAPEDLNKIISELADSFGCYHLSIKSIFEKYSPNGLVGNNLMTEHLHPNIDGYFIMADGFVNALHENKMIEKKWDTLRIKPWAFYRNNWGFTELDSMIAVLRIKNLKSGWPFQPVTTINNFIFTYKPNGVIDSLAFMAVKYDDISIERVHKDLAAYYQSIGDLKQASEEYLSLAYIYTNKTSYYYLAGDLANKAKDYDNATRIFLESPNSDTSEYVQMSLASIYFAQGKFKEALLSIDKLQMINLSEENFLLSEKLKYKIQKTSGLILEAEKTLGSIKKLEPGFNESGEGKTLLILVPEKVKYYIEKAEKLRKNGQLNEALSVLAEANSIQETAFANLFIGKILLKQNNLNALNYLEKAYKEIKDDASLTYNLSLLYLMKENFTKAEDVMNDFIKLKGVDDPQFQKLIALYEKRSGEPFHK